MPFDPYAVWFTQPFAVVDFEATHQDPREARPVEIGIARWEHGELVDTWSSLLQPGIPIPAGSFAVHGISDTDVADAPTLVHVIPDILRLTRNALPVAYNVTYDKTVLHRALARTALTDLECVPVFDPAVRWIDPLTWARVLDNERSNTLAAVCARHDITVLESHRAKADAVSAGLVLLALLDAIGPMTVTELLRQQQAHHEAQEARFASWREKREKHTGAPF